MNYLNDLKTLAERAFYWTSFDSRGRAERVIKEHENMLSDDLEKVPESEKENYINKFKEKLASWLAAESRCASSAVAGASKFNVYKAQKANDIAHKRYGEFLSWREWTLKKIEKQKEMQNRKQIEFVNYLLSRKNDEIEFKNGKIIKNFNINRLQLSFNNKPSPELINQLKHNGFHWSPSNKVWQRQLTDNAIRATNKLLSENDLTI